MWIDSHCHLNHSGIKPKGSPEAIVKAAKKGGVDGMVTVCCCISKELQELQEITAHNDNVWCTIGTHPHDSGLEKEKAYSAEDIATLVKSNNKIIGIGETGLDYYYDNSPREEQRASFVKHVQACIEAGVPMIVHTRDAEKDTACIMKNEGQGSGLTGVMHCFSSEQWLAEEALDMGFYISFSGIVTFNKSEALRETAKLVPLDRVLIETDAPFLAPVPFRGKVNEPAYVAHTGTFLADIYGLSAEEFAKITTENFYRLFTKAKYVETGS
ncbi:MAG: TatD family hydrolase [Alphaproteobacteria bacterium]|nr:TatD family hydrolase [Alphaproteobacteria bacterium]